MVAFQGLSRGFGPQLGRKLQKAAIAQVKKRVMCHRNAPCAPDEAMFLIQERVIVAQRPKLFHHGPGDAARQAEPRRDSTVKRDFVDQFPSGVRRPAMGRCAFYIIRAERRAKEIPRHAAQMRGHIGRKSRRIVGTIRPRHARKRGYRAAIPVDFKSGKLTETEVKCHPDAARFQNVNREKAHVRNPLGVFCSNRPVSLMRLLMNRGGPIQLCPASY